MPETTIITYRPLDRAHGQAYQKEYAANGH
jgi:hypothetical protein